MVLFSFSSELLQSTQILEVVASWEECVVSQQVFLVVRASLINQANPVVPTVLYYCLGYHF